MGRNGYDAACDECGYIFPPQLSKDQVLIGGAVECPECGAVLVNGEWVKPPSAEVQEGAARVTVAKERLIAVE